jgi:hypothetical protein
MSYTHSLGINFYFFGVAYGVPRRNNKFFSLYFERDFVEALSGKKNPYFSTSIFINC